MSEMPKFLLKQCQVTINNIFGKISVVHEVFKKYITETKAIDRLTATIAFFIKKVLH